MSETKRIHFFHTVIPIQVTFIVTFFSSDVLFTRKFFSAQQQKNAFCFVFIFTLFLFFFLHFFFLVHYIGFYYFILVLFFSASRVPCTRCMNKQCTANSNKPSRDYYFAIVLVLYIVNERQREKKVLLWKSECDECITGKLQKLQTQLTKRQHTSHTINKLLLYFLSRKQKKSFKL